MKLLTRSEELILLAILKLGEEAYCVRILDRLREVSDKDWTLGGIYMTLDRLEKRDRVESEFGTPTAERGGKRKRFYKVTPVGVEALKATHRVEKAMWDGVEDVVCE
jgi:DNA-binding PadR family transcriptional regulator